VSDSTSRQLIDSHRVLDRSQSIETQCETQRIVKNDRMPLAIYRELATHLEQVEGVAVDCLPQDSTTFDYLLSQLGGLRIHLPNDPEAAHQVDHILAYYGDRYGAWTELKSEV
jgi:hypothetical protein